MRRRRARARASDRSAPRFWQLRRPPATFWELALRAIHHGDSFRILISGALTVYWLVAASGSLGDFDRVRSRRTIRWREVATRTDGALLAVPKAVDRPREESGLESEDVLANAVSFLIDGREFDAAHLLLACSELNFSVTREHGFEGVDLGAVLTGPRALYDAVDAWAAYPQLVEEERRDLENGVRWESPPEPALTHGAVDGIKRALQACTPPNQDVVYLSALVEGPGAYEGWRREMAEAATQVIHNQAVNAERVVTWANLRFRSQSEVRIAKALSNADVMFLPNCRARLPLGDHGMGNREPDFLVCADGKWGILEVDGEPWHPASRAAQDHERDRLFRRQGVRIIERYAASRCYDAPTEVVDEFLNLLRSS